MKKVKYFFIYELASFIISIALLFITALVFAYTNINDRYLNMFVFGIVAISVLIGSMLFLRKIKEKGILYGVIFGLIYILLIYLFTMIFFKGLFFTNTTLIYALICMLSGLVGGIVGVNI